MDGAHRRADEARQAGANQSCYCVSGELNCRRNATMSSNSAKRAMSLVYASASAADCCFLPAMASSIDAERSHRLLLVLAGRVARYGAGCQLRLVTGKLIDQGCPLAIEN